MLHYFLLSLGIVFNVVAHTLAKRATVKFPQIQGLPFGEIVVSLLTNVDLILSIVFYGFSFVAYVIALSKIHLHIAYPVTVSASIVLVTLMSVFVFREAMHMYNFLGIAFILAGIVLITLR